MKECIICNKRFEPHHWKQKCCIGKCMQVNRTHTRKLYEQSQKCQDYRARYEATDKRICLKREYENNKKRKIYRLIWDKSPKRKEYRSKWNKSYKARLIQFRYNHKRRANKNNIIEMFTVQQWIKMKEATKGICPCCNKDVGLDNITLDHVYAINLANDDFELTGTKRIYCIDDIQPLCRSCNSSKQIKNINYISKCEVQQVAV